MSAITLLFINQHSSEIFNNSYGVLYCFIIFLNFLNSFSKDPNCGEVSLYSGLYGVFVVHVVILKSLLYLRKAAAVRTRVFAYTH